MTIRYSSRTSITVDQFLDLLVRSTLGERRPIHDRECLKGMIDQADLVITAWDQDRLVGLARSVTDFAYACYLSDLAVDSDYQRRGLGKRLQAETQARLGPRCKLILIAAPAADAYYASIGFTRNERCWVLERDQRIR